MSKIHSNFPLTLPSSKKFPKILRPPEICNLLRYFKITKPKKNLSFPSFPYKKNSSRFPQKKKEMLWL